MESDNSRKESSPLEIPVLLIMLALLIWGGFQTTQLIKERLNLRQAMDEQEQLVVNGKKMRTQLDAIAAGTKRLADQGNANAQMIVQQLAKNGININPSAQGASAP